MVYEGWESTALDEYLCDRGAFSGAADIQVSALPVGGVFDFFPGDWLRGTGRWVASVYDW